MQAVFLGFYFESDSNFLIFVLKDSDLYISSKIEAFLERKTAKMVVALRIVHIAHLRSSTGYKRNTNLNKKKKRNLKNKTNLSNQYFESSCNT